MQSWEYVVIAIGVAFVALAVYLIVVLKNVNNAVGKIDNLLNSNSENINIIITNVEGISGSVNDICSTTKGVVDQVGDAVSSCVPAKGSGDSSVLNGNDSADNKSLKSIIGFVSFAISGIKLIGQFKEKNRTKQLLKELKKQNKR